LGQRLKTTASVLLVFTMPIWGGISLTECKDRVSHLSVEAKLTGSCLLVCVESLYSRLIMMVEGSFEVEMAEGDFKDLLRDNLLHRNQRINIQLAVQFKCSQFVTK